MKKLSTIVLLLISLTIYAQKDATVTDSFVVKGELKKELKFNLADIEKYQPKAINTDLITNYNNESGNVATQIKGVLLKDILKGQQYKNPNAQDAYTVIIKNVAGNKLVYSWNEVFNSPIGDALYIITSIDGSPSLGIKDRILVITPTVLKSGHSYIKNLNEINIEKGN